MSTSSDSKPTSSTPPPAKPSPTQPTQPTNRPPPLLLALSGPTSSGKTTLATALRSIFTSPLPSSDPDSPGLPTTATTITIIHADDFYKPDSQIPLTETGVRDWDCAGSLDLERLFAVLRGVKGGGGGEGEGEGRVRQGNFEGGDGDGDGVHDPLKSNSGTITRETIARIRAQRNQMPPPTNRQPPPLVIVEGFLLFGRSIPAPLRELFDVKILLRASYGDAKARRERRNGYVTLEGFWRDPEGYFDEVVWPGYVREHGGLVGREGGGYVEGPPGEGGGDGGGGGGGGGMGVWVSDPGWGLEECLEWIVGVVGRVVERSC